MQVRYILLWLMCFVGQNVYTQNSRLTLEDAYLKNLFQVVTPPPMHFLSDDAHYLMSTGTAITKHRLDNGQRTAILFDALASAAQLQGKKPDIAAYTLSGDETKLLLEFESEPLFRHSTQASCLVVDVKTGLKTWIKNAEKIRYPMLSPNGEFVAFVQSNNLFVQEIRSGKLQQITTDGQINAIINGAADWVYEEEFELTRAFAWSPDSRHIAFLRFDEQAVPFFTMSLYKGGVYPEYVSYKYPKVGQPNATLSAWVYSLDAAQTLPIKLPLETGDYIPRLQWSPTGEVCLTRLNRHQNELHLYLAKWTTPSWETRAIYHETSETYIDIQDVVRFQPKGVGFFWVSDKSGWNHVYLISTNNGKEQALTSGEWDVTQLYGYDEKNENLYIQRAPDALNRRVAVVSKEGKLKDISPAQGWAEAQFTPSFEKHVLKHSDAANPPVFTLVQANGKTVRVLEDNQALKVLKTTFKAQPVSFFTVKAADNKTNLNGFMISPAEMQQAGRKYPVMVYMYGGPGSQTVMNKWNDSRYFWWFQYLASQGIAVVSVDNRGTGGRGRDFKKATYLKLGELETADQLALISYLQQQSNINPKQIAVVGKSYGGYLASMVLFQGAERVKAGIALAPVSHWRWYDSAYTERYMRTEEENPHGYEVSAPLHYVNKLEGNYLLVHGTADDNVHYQHSTELADALIAANKPFESFYYTNRNHALSGGNTSYYLFSQLTRFLERGLELHAGGLNPRSSLSGFEIQEKPQRVQFNEKEKKDVREILRKNK